MKKQIISASLLVTGFLIGATALSAIAGTWTAPGCTPPNCNVDAPVNVGGGDYATGDPRNFSQLKTGLLGLNDLMVKNLQVLTSAGTTTATEGQVLTATDDNGTVGWRNVGAGGGDSSVVFITPVSLTTVGYTSLGSNWYKINAASYIPSGASAVIIQGSGIYNRIDIRKDSSSPTYPFYFVTNSNAMYYSQALFPITDTRSFDLYGTDPTPSNWSNNIKIVGYIIGSLDVAQSNTGSQYDFDCVMVYSNTPYYNVCVKVSEQGQVSGSIQSFNNNIAVYNSDQTDFSAYKLDINGSGPYSINISDASIDNDNPRVRVCVMNSSGLSTCSIGMVDSVRSNGGNNSSWASSTAPF